MYNPKSQNVVETRDFQWEGWHGGHLGKPIEDINKFMDPKSTEEMKNQITQTKYNEITQDYKCVNHSTSQMNSNNKESPRSDGEWSFDGLQHEQHYSS